MRDRTRAGDVVAVSDVGFSVARGGVLGLVGESGSGGSTVARVVARFHDASGGEIRQGGEAPARRLRGRALRRFRQRVQMTFQDPYASLNLLSRVGCILARPLRIHGLGKGDIPAQVNALLDRVSLSPPEVYAAKRPLELSGGQRQRVGIARALASRPELSLADEPTSALNLSIRLDIMTLLLDLNDQEGLSMLFITHDLAGKRCMGDRVAVLSAGHLVETGPATAVIDDPQRPYTRRLPPVYDVGGGHQARCLLHDPAITSAFPVSTVHVPPSASPLN